MDLEPFDLSGRVALVTGAGAPDVIGFATARLLVAMGRQSDGGNTISEERA